METREDRVMDYLYDYIAYWGYPPSVREIATAFGRSVGTVSVALDRLESEGRIVRTKGIARGLTILEEKP